MAQTKDRKLIPWQGIRGRPCKDKLHGGELHHAGQPEAGDACDDREFLEAQDTTSTRNPGAKGYEHSLVSL